MIARLTDLSLRHRRWVLALWVVVLLVGFAAAPRAVRPSHLRGRVDRQQRVGTGGPGDLAGRAER